MPKVKRLPGGHFGAVVDGPPHPDGRRNQVRIQKRTRAEAQAALLAVQQERLARKQAIDRGPTLGEFCDDFAAFHFPQVADKTSVRYRGIIDVHITTDPIAAIRLRDLTPQDVRQWITRLRAKPGRTARTLSPLSVRHCVMLLRLILRTAVKWGQLDSNPASEVDLPTSRRDPTRLRSWQADEAQEFLDAMSTSTAPNALLWRATVGLALTTGIRR